MQVCLGEAYRGCITKSSSQAKSYLFRPRNFLKTTLGLGLEFTTLEIGEDYYEGFAMQPCNDDTTFCTISKIALDQCLYKTWQSIILPRISANKHRIRMCVYNNKKLCRIFCGQKSHQTSVDLLADRTFVYPRVAVFSARVYF